MFDASRSHVVARPLEADSTPPAPVGHGSLRSGKLAERLARLQRSIETELIPQLLVSYRVGLLPPAPAPTVTRQPSDADVTAFVAAVRGADDGLAAELLQGLIDNGTPIETVYLELLAPAARRLGELWEVDECDFIDVTLAMGRMQRMLRDLSQVFLADATRSETVGNVLLSCIPGEQHTLGIIMVGEFLLRDGWRVLVGAPWTDSDLMSMVSTEWYDIIGFSVGCESRMTVLKREVRRLRAASRNPNVRVLVGGQVFSVDPELVARVGADGYATSAQGAPEIARALLADSKRRTSIVRTRSTNSGDGELSEAIRHE